MVGVSGIRTRIIAVVGERADHTTSRTVSFYALFTLLAFAVIHESQRVLFREAINIYE